VGRRRAGLIGIVAALATLAACAPSGGTHGDGAWTWTETRVNGFWRSQGLATDPQPAPGRADDTWYTSQFSLERADADGTGQGLVGSLPLDVLAIWKNSHTGDPDAHGGRVILPWENKQLGPSNPPTKSFGVYDETTLELIGWSKHVLVPGETNDNPWVTISPDGAWMLSGRYAPMPELEVFPVPVAPFADIPRSATIPLDRPAYEVQGCDFVHATQLVCASNNEETGKQVFLLDLDAPVGGGASSATLTYVGAAPQLPPLLGESVEFCEDSGEIEGVDAAPVPGGGVLVRLLVIDRCFLVVHEYQHLIQP
jgi:hypothetical protein